MFEWISSYSGNMPCVVINYLWGGGSDIAVLQSDIGMVFAIW